MFGSQITGLFYQSIHFFSAKCKRFNNSGKAFKTSSLPSSFLSSFLLSVLLCSVASTEVRVYACKQPKPEEMALQTTMRFSCLLSGPKEDSSFEVSCITAPKERTLMFSSLKIKSFALTSSKSLMFPLLGSGRSRASNKVEVEVESNDEKKKGVEEGKTSENDEEEGPSLMDNEERKEWRSKIREVLDRNPEVKEEEDPIERQKKMQQLLAEYPLVVEEEDPNWPEDADGWGFSLGQFFNKIEIKNVKKDDDDENYESDKEIVWQDDNYVRPIKEITTKEWEETVFKDISPLVVFVHNRYRRPKENEKVREALENVAHIFWNTEMPSPRCVGVDAVVELDLVSALKVSVFPEVIYTKAGKILYRDKAIRTADELSKIMAFFYYGAVKPPCLEIVGDKQESIPSVP